MAIASPIASIVVFLVSLLIGALGIYAGARIIVGRTSYDHAIVTALIGAIVWAIVGFVVGWIPSSDRCWPCWRTSRSSTGDIPATGPPRR